jgi:hypothetical protein
MICTPSLGSSSASSPLASQSVCHVGCLIPMPLTLTPSSQRNALYPIQGSPPDRINISFWDKNLLFIHHSHTSPIDSSSTSCAYFTSHTGSKDNPSYIHLYSLGLTHSLLYYYKVKAQ